MGLYWLLCHDTERLIFTNIKFPRLYQSRKIFLQTNIKIVFNRRSNLVIVSAQNWRFDFKPILKRFWLLNELILSVSQIEIIGTVLWFRDSALPTRVVFLCRINRLRKLKMNSIRISITKVKTKHASCFQN